MGIEVIVEFIAKTTVRVLAYIYNDADALVNPTTSTKITITDPDGTTKVSGVAMSLVSGLTGVYEYFYKTDTTLVKGWWRGEIVAIDGVTPDDRTSLGTFSFRLK